MSSASNLKIINCPFKLLEYCAFTVLKRLNRRNPFEFATSIMNADSKMDKHMLNLAVHNLSNSYSCFLLVDYSFPCFY